LNNCLSKYTIHFYFRQFCLVSVLTKAKKVI